MKKIVSAIIVLAMCLSFCACSNSEQTTETACAHSYNASTKEATCTDKGSIKYTCAECGDSYNEVIPAKGHTYSDGSCTVCDARKPSEGLEYTKSGSTYSVTGIGTCTDTNIVIADYHDGLPVTSISLHAFSDASKVESVFVPDTVTDIGMFAFSGCSSLTEIHLSRNLTEIDIGAFLRCKSLVSVEFPEGITALPDNIFERCENLSRVTLPGSITSIGKASFMLCGSLTEIVIPENVVSVGDSAFYGCTGLSRIVIPSSVQTIGEGIFRLDRTLTHIYCEAESEPYGWHIDWKAVCNAAVHWKNDWEYIDGVPTVK